jgi:hypothetical protein
VPPRAKERSYFSVGQTGRFWVYFTPGLAVGDTVATIDAAETWLPIELLEFSATAVVSPGGLDAMLSVREDPAGASLVVGNLIVLTLVVTTTAGDVLPFEFEFEVV